MTPPLVVIPGAYALAIADSGAWGTLDFQADDRENLLVVSGYSKAGRSNRRNMSDWHRRHYLSFADERRGVGVWYRVEPEIHEAWQQVANRGAVIPTEYLKEHVPSGWRAPPADAAMFVLATSVPAGGGVPTWSGWWVSRESALPGSVSVVDEDADLLAPLAGAWPVEMLSDELVVMVGAGSIGSAAAESLVGYGVRKLALVDPDHLRSHNFARHRVHPRQVGRRKVTALADHLRDRDPSVQIAALAMNVVDYADVMRPLLAEANGMLVSSDGVESRRVANHLAHRAGVPTVLACVLDDGGIGEVLRVLPRRTGCLLCTRAALADEDGIDPEPSLDRDYGMGTRHRPMTAVGSDLGLVGQLAAKVIVSTLLERRGLREHRLPHDHAILGLRDGSMLAAPFNVAAGEVRWRDTPRPRSDCPTCSSG